MAPRPIARGERAIVAVAAAIIVLQVCFLVLSLGAGLAQELGRALSDDEGCPNGMATVLTERGEVACLSSNIRLPDGWTRIP